MTETLTCHLNCGLPIAQDISKIIVHGAKEHNLKNICFEIPKGKLVALTGVSGSGKSSIATDILQKECLRQYLESLGMTTDHIEKAKVEWMAAYQLIILPRAEKELKKLPAKDFSKIDGVILQLLTDPRPVGCKKLQGIADTYRVRVGDYRILYRVEDKQLIIEVIRIANRKDVYKR